MSLGTGWPHEGTAVQTHSAEVISIAAGASKTVLMAEA